MKPEQKELTKASNNTKSKKENAKAVGKDSLKDEQLTLSEMEVVTTVFKSYETGLRQATILPKVRLCFVLLNDHHNQTQLKSF